MHRFLRPGLLLALAVAIACSDANSLGDPTETNVTDTVTLGAIEGTSIATTRAVVNASLLVLMFNFVLSAMLFR